MFKIKKVPSIVSVRSGKSLEVISDSAKLWTTALVLLKNISGKFNHANMKKKLNMKCYFVTRLRNYQIHKIYTI